MAESNDIPNFQAFMRPLLEVLAEHVEPIRASQAHDLVAARLRLSEEARAQTLPSGHQRTYRNRSGWAATYLRFADLLVSPKRGHWVITNAGRELLAKHAGEVNLQLLETLPAYIESRKRVDQEGAGDELEVEEDGGSAVDAALRIQLKVERALPSPTERRAALELLAFVIENADEERADGWTLQETARGLTLRTARQVAFKLGAGTVSVSVIGPIDEAVRAELQVNPERDDPWKNVPDAVTITFPAERSSKALELLVDPIDAFVDWAMARAKSPVNQERHVREAVDYVAKVVGRELPQPEPPPASALGSAEDDEAEPGADAKVSHAPVQRGRAPIFESGNRAVGTLVDEIDRGGIALPDMQRPFVWEDAKVRDLLDSLFLGFPVGTLVLWRTAEEREARAFGAEDAALRATTLVIDGQQRLTSLYAVLRGKPVVDKDGTRRQITIAFRPRDGRFEVADAAIRQDPEYLPNVTELWTGPRTKSTIKRELLNTLREKGRHITDAYEDAVDQNLDRAQLISDFRFPTVEIRPIGGNQGVTEEDVADIFVRINNQGTRLAQADFVLTLLSVFHGNLRDRIELGARELSENSVVSLDVHQLLRATCAVGFGRARMSAIYSYLRGVDPSSREVDAASRKRRLEELDAAAARCLHATTWRDFVLRVQRAGFVDASLIASAGAVVNAYALYVLGLERGVERHCLDEAISRWIFGTLLTSRYSGASTDSAFEQDLSRLRETAGPERFIGTLDTLLSSVIAGDYWTRTLIADLETQRSRAPAALAFRAAQVVLGARALFSDQPLSTLLSSNGHAGRSAHEQHHLFPKAWLARTPFKEKRFTNQVANLADVGWYDNADIGSSSPDKYIPRLKQKRGWTDEQWGRACTEHALPPAWETMPYEVFLPERRTRMAHIIRAAYHALGGEPEATPINPPWFLPGAEQVWSQIAETERALRTLVRTVYTEVFGDQAAAKIEATFQSKERESLERAMRARPSGSDPLSVVDYLYLAQLPALLFNNAVWETARRRLSAPDAKQKLQSAISIVTPVRNEIAHVREVAPERLQRASLACGDILGLIGAKESR